jgi:hypothetical protein
MSSEAGAEAMPAHNEDRPGRRARSAANQDAGIRGARHTPIMTVGSDALPVLVIDGANFSDLDGFAREFSSLLCHYT